ncbi:MAG: hypothetical protein D6800_04435, partial [Candidatus Zixiibacteriota bacterium]
LERSERGTGFAKGRGGVGISLCQTYRVSEYQTSCERGEFSHTLRFLELLRTAVLRASAHRPPGCGAGKTGKGRRRRGLWARGEGQLS